MNIQILQKETKYNTNDQKLATLKSGHFKTIFIHLMGLLNGHLIDLVKTSIYQNIKK
jgi:hypothetical protein